MSEAQSDHDFVTLSERFLREARSGEHRGPARTRLAEGVESAISDLDHSEGLAFWLNVYNAAARAALTDKPAQFENRRRFFSKPLVIVSGTVLSLDQIEHGVLRRSQWKYGLGYVPNPFQSAFVRRHRLDELDPRIHFALNCGAASCPPIAAYAAASIDEQLDQATEQYLRDEIVRESGVIYVPRLLLWFRGDFGGRSGIRRMLREYGCIGLDERPRVRYRSYDWSLALDEFLDSDDDP